MKVCADFLQSLWKSRFTLPPVIYIQQELNTLITLFKIQKNCEITYCTFNMRPSLLTWQQAALPSQASCPVLVPSVYRWTKWPTVCMTLSTAMSSWLQHCRVSHTRCGVSRLRPNRWLSTWRSVWCWRVFHHHILCIASSSHALTLSLSYVQSRIYKRLSNEQDHWSMDTTIWMAWHPRYRSCCWSPLLLIASRCKTR